MIVLCSGYVGAATTVLRLEGVDATISGGQEQGVIELVSGFSTVTFAGAVPTGATLTVRKAGGTSLTVTGSTSLASGDGTLALGDVTLAAPVTFVAPSNLGTTLLFPRRFMSMRSSPCVFVWVGGQCSVRPALPLFCRAATI